jgi:LuxR family maltose regulon positive regulatory protein/serine/threonine-protein kinase PknK
MTKVQRLSRAVSTKFQAPAHGDGLIRRERLIAQLHGGRRRRLALIHGPAGYGKTTLAVQWQKVLRDEGVPVGWLTLDADDNEVSWFLAHLIESVRRVEPSLPVELDDVLEQTSDDVPRIVLTELVNHVVTQGRPLALVLDDWHLIESPETTAALDFLLEAGGDNLHLVITSRTRSPRISRLRLDDQVTEIDATQLRFDQAESADFLRASSQLDLDDEDLQRLWSSTDGWIAALQLAKLSLRDSADPSALIRTFSGRHHSIGDYLTENVLNALPAEVLEFLLTTSICDRLCGDLAAAVSGERRGQVMLEELERRDLFLRPLDEEREWFRYHHLFAAHLRRRLERDYPDKVVTLHRTASVWFGDHGYLNEAVTHALAAGNDAGAIDLVERKAMDLVELSQMATLIRLVNKLPPALLPERPYLQRAIAWANCLLQRADEAQTALDHVRAAAGGDMDSRHLEEILVEADVVQACIDVYRDRIDRVVALVAPVLKPHATVRAFVVAVAANIQTFVDIHTFNFDVALQRQRSAAKFQAASGGPFVGVYGRCFAGLAAFAKLDVTTAERMFQEALALARGTAGKHSHAAALASALLGRVRYERGDIDGAEELLEACHELGAESGVVEFMVATYLTLARIKVLRGDVDAAWALLEEGADVATQFRLPRLMAAVEYERVRLHLAVGENARANDVVSQAGDRAQADADGIAVATREYDMMMRARAMSANGQHDEAVALLTELREQRAAASRPYAEVDARIELATAQLIAGQRVAAAETAAPALLVAARAGLRRSVVDAGPAFIRLISELRDAQRCQRWPEGLPPVPVDYLSRLLATAHADDLHSAVRVVKHPTARNSLPEEPLNGREIDILRLLARGLANKEIARTLGLTINTVKWYLKSIYVKLGVTRRGESVAEARRRRILD